MKKILILMMGLIMLVGCSNNDYKEIMANNEYVIIDVRTSEEYADGHIVDALNIPYDVIENEIDISKDIIIFVYCRSGNRSSIAYNTLKNLGYTVYDLGAYDNIDLEKE